MCAADGWRRRYCSGAHGWLAFASVAVSLRNHERHGPWWTYVPQCKQVALQQSQFEVKRKLPAAPALQCPAAAAAACPQEGRRSEPPQQPCGGLCPQAPPRQGCREAEHGSTASAGRRCTPSACPACCSSCVGCHSPVCGGTHNRAWQDWFWLLTTREMRMLVTLMPPSLRHMRPRLKGVGLPRCAKDAASAVLAVGHSCCCEGMLAGLGTSRSLQMRCRQPGAKLTSCLSFQPGSRHRVARKCLHNVTCTKTLGLP